MTARPAPVAAPKIPKVSMISFSCYNPNKFGSKFLVKFVFISFTRHFISL